MFAGHKQRAESTFTYLFTVLICWSCVKLYLSCHKGLNRENYFAHFVLVQNFTLLGPHAQNKVRQV